MRADYYQNILYPLQDRVLKIISPLSVDFYLTGGTALGRGYLNHRYSDDLDFFVNADSTFKNQVNTIIAALNKSGLTPDVASADDDFVRLFLFADNCSLKIDFVNDIPFRKGRSTETSLFVRTDNLINILSNKITALSRLEPKDVVDILFICINSNFNWLDIFIDASEKDIWANPVNTSEILEKFPVEKTAELAWTGELPSETWFASQISVLIKDILEGEANSLCKMK